MRSASTTVIQWIRSSNEKQPTFVANRVAEILDTSTVDEWHHVEGAKNPADLGTRGLSFDDIANSNWIKGPDWLLQPILLNEDTERFRLQLGRLTVCRTKESYSQFTVKRTWKLEQAFTMSRR